MTLFKRWNRFWQRVNDPNHIEFARLWKGAQAAQGHRRLTLQEALFLTFGKGKAESFHRLFRITEQAPPLEPTESVAFTFLRPKIAAILFDRISSGVSIWDAEVPAKFVYADDGLVHEFFFTDDTANAPNFDSIKAQLESNPTHYENLIPRYIAGVTKKLGRPVISLFGSKEAFDAVYAPGKREVLAIALEKLPLIDENKLDWDQVAELRSDTAARDSVRKFISWADTNLVGKSAEEISDQIGNRLGSYLKALKKHGIRKRQAVAESLLDFRSKCATAGVAAGLHGMGLEATVAALAGVTLAFGDIVLSISKKLLDLEDKADQVRASHSEIAFLATYTGNRDVA
jgi:hypothetical protein